MIIFVIQPKYILAGVGVVVIVGAVLGVGWHILRSVQMLHLF